MGPYISAEWGHFILIVAHITHRFFGKPIFVVFVISAPSKGGATGSEEKAGHGRIRRVERAKITGSINEDIGLVICKPLLIQLLVDEEYRKKLWGLSRRKVAFFYFFWKR